MIKEFYNDFLKEGGKNSPGVWLVTQREKAAKVDWKKVGSRVAVGAAIVVGNTVAGGVIYEQHRQVNSLKERVSVLEDWTANLEDRLSFTERAQGFELYSNCRNARAIFYGTSEAQQEEDAEFCRIAISQTEFWRPR